MYTVDSVFVSEIHHYVQLILHCAQLTFHRTHAFIHPRTMIKHYDEMDLVIFVWRRESDPQGSSSSVTSNLGVLLRPMCLEIFTGLWQWKQQFTGTTFWISCAVTHIHNVSDPLFYWVTHHCSLSKNPDHYNCDYTLICLLCYIIKYWIGLG